MNVSEYILKIYQVLRGFYSTSFASVLQFAKMKVTKCNGHI